MEYLVKSPFHFWSACFDPTRRPEDPTPAQRLGSAIHCAVLEPAEFLKRYALAPQVDRRTKSGKEVFEAFLVASAGKLVLTDREWEICERIQINVRSNHAAQAILEEGDAEVTLVWEDPIEGVLCKGRLDWLSVDAIVDIKSTDSAAPGDFARKIAQYFWHSQAAWYVDGLKILTGEDTERAFVIAALEKDEPFSAAFYTLEEEALTVGRMRNRTLVAQYAQCIKNNSWPSYPEQINQIKLPSWAMKGDQNVRPVEF